LFNLENTRKVEPLMEIAVRRFVVSLKREEAEAGVLS
jgi:hypothetical protein